MIYTYRYLWLEKGKETTFCKILTGLEKEHDAFIERIKAQENIVKCTRVYMCEYDPLKLEDYENIKSEAVTND